MPPCTCALQLLVGGGDCLPAIQWCLGTPLMAIWRAATVFQLVKKDMLQYLHTCNNSCHAEPCVGVIAGILVALS